MKLFFQYMAWAVAACLYFSALPALAQEGFPGNGIPDKRPEVYAFTNATIYVDFQTVLQNATLLVAQGKVLDVGAGLVPPKGAQVIDLKGKTIYPGLIDLYADYGIEKPRPAQGGDGFAAFFREQWSSDKKGAYGWNKAVKPETRAEELFVANAKDAKAWRDLGFGAALTHLTDGIARGTGALVSLADGKEHDLVLKGGAAAHYSFAKGTSNQPYPTSLMGAAALLRQTYLDAQWYKSNPGAQFNLSLDAWNRLQALPQIFEVNDKLNALRADKIGDEFGKQFIIKGSGNEYQRMAEIKATGASFILPLEFPEAYDVDDPLDAARVSLAELKHWELAPTNPAALANAGIDFALTPAGLKNKADFFKNLQKAIEHGLDKKMALKALTHTPAKLLGADNMLGALKKGMVANFIITSKDLFEKDNVIYENWVQGKRYVVKPWDFTDLRADYKLNVNGEALTLKIAGEAEKPSFAVSKDTIKYTTSGTVNGKLLTLSYEIKGKGKVRLSGWRADSGQLAGEGQNEAGQWIKWQAERSADFKAEEKKAAAAAAKAPELGKVTFPFTAFGYTEMPKAEAVLFKNATVWTNEAEGILKNTDVLVRNGKIERIGQNLPTEGLLVVNAEGKHLTSGIIDEHSHIATMSVNEGVNSNSSEVRIGDVLNSEDINMYRQLAGGVIGAQILHGSANAIGGQSALIKFRWGLAPEQLKIQGADGFIKFALGENVKRASAPSGSTRYPQTRMGVEQVYADAFTRAREYEQALKTNPTGTRRDLQMDAMVEILNKKRFITCHSYVQSEINMLMKVAERFNFRINTFTHILEGYKVADKMKAHGVAASSFADWWAYKYEVWDAIPQNPALLHSQGVVTAINSDDAEMARRLNQEAAKSVKYANMSEEDAWKMVTLNPAKMLHLDSRTGSIKAGKDADLVLWTDNPLSIYARAEKTLVDGVVYYDATTDRQLREQVRQERNRIIQKMVAAKASGEATRRPFQRMQEMKHCEDMDEAYINGE